MLDRIVVKYAEALADYLPGLILVLFGLAAIVVGVAGMMR